MLRYALLNAAILGAVFVVVRSQYGRLFTRRWLYVLGILLALTLVFDSLIILFGIVAYNPDYLLGIYLGRAPLEDFAYTVAAAMLIPFVWHKTKEIK